MAGKSPGNEVVSGGACESRQLKKKTEKQLFSYKASTTVRPIPTEPWRKALQLLSRKLRLSNFLPSYLRSAPQVCCVT